jgi:hypothetical protein
MRVFVSFDGANRLCAESVRADLDARGYAIYSRQPGDGGEAVADDWRVIEASIRSSNFILLLWSADAARSESIESQIVLAERLKKKVFLIITDDTPLPVMLGEVRGVRSTPACLDAVVRLLPDLPAANEDDVLTRLLEELSHEHIRVRKEGIHHAADLLNDEAYRQDLLPLLEDIARADPVGSVREAARGVLGRGDRIPTAVRNQDEARHFFPARCLYGHITYYDKREFCPAARSVVRSARDSAPVLDMVEVTCRGCGEVMKVPINCEGYK